MSVRRLNSVVGSLLVLLGLGDVVLDRWRGAIFLLVAGGILLILRGEVGEKILPRRVEDFLHPRTARGAAVFAVTCGYLAVAGALAFVLLNDPVPGGVMLASASLIIGLGLRQLRQARRSDQDA